MMVHLSCVIEKNDDLQGYLRGLKKLAFYAGKPTRDFLIASFAPIPI